MMRNNNGNIKCCGCGACVSICPSNCVELSYDDEGFYVAEIHSERCVECNLCKMICPLEKQSNDIKLKSVFIAKSKRDDVIKISSSGGVFFEMASWILSDCGVVYGCIMDENQKAVHSRAETIDNVLPMLGSKYVQSYIGDIFKSVKKDLECGRKVLFSGTPCQIHGLSNCVEGYSENLFLVDVFCHGISSPGIFSRYINKYEEYYGKMRNTSFRNKNDGWRNFCVAHTFMDGNYIEIPHLFDPYFQLFQRDYSLNKVCYDCDFKGGKSKADISIGDAWGYRSFFDEIDDDTGISVIAVNSEKGLYLLDEIKSSLNIESAPNQLAKENNGYSGRIIPSRLREELFNQYKSNDDFELLSHSAHINGIARKYISDRNKKVIMWGTGYIFEKYHDLILEKFEVVGCCDNDVSKWNSSIDGLTIYQPSEILKIDNVLIVIMLKDVKLINAVVSQLIDIGISDFIEARDVLLNEWEE